MAAVIVPPGAIVYVPCQARANRADVSQYFREGRRPPENTRLSGPRAGAQLDAGGHPYEPPFHKSPYRFRSACQLLTPAEFLHALKQRNRKQDVHILTFDWNEHSHKHTGCTAIPQGGSHGR